MIPAAFDYHRATSLDNAVSVLAEHGDEAKVLAGGHSLLPFMKLRFASPSALIDINGLRELDYVTLDGDRLRIGALTRHRTIHEDSVVAANLPLLAYAAGTIGDPQVRARGTLGGSVAHADPAGEFPALCRMLDAEIVTTSRSLPAGAFFEGRYTTPLAHDELIREVAFPVVPHAGSYLKFSHRPFDWAVVGALAVQADDGWHLGLINVSDTPVRATEAEAALASGASAQEAAALATAGLAPPASHRGSSEYKAHLATVLMRRSIVAASTAS